MKKVGGLRSSVRSQGPGAPRPVPPTTAAKTVGGLKPSTVKLVGTRLGHKQTCCAGEYRDIMWIHSPGCDETVALWKAHGKTAKDWSCRFGCTPTETPSAFVHHYQCEFWNAHPALTPFDKIIPVNKRGRAVEAVEDGDAESTESLPF